MITTEDSPWMMDAAQARRTMALTLNGIPPLEVSADALAGVPHFMGRLSSVARGIHPDPDPPFTLAEAAAMVRLSGLLDGQLGIGITPWQAEHLHTRQNTTHHEGDQHHGRQ